MILLGIDIGSSSVKASLLDAESGACLGAAQHPPHELPIHAPQAGWAEQDPEQWWESARAATVQACADNGVDASAIGAVGIAYQMHGLVCLDTDGKPLRPAIIWCDSRAVDIGNQAFQTLGPDQCLGHLLNSPGNFTASKLKWVQDNEPELYARIDKICLPGDYLALRLTGRLCTTVSGLSEGMFWDFSEGRIAGFLLDHFGMDSSLLAETVGTFAPQGEITTDAAAAFGIPAGIPVAYRAGDQPNNAFSLNVLETEMVAATAGTSGVVYGVSDQVKYDPQSRVNTFAHVNHSPAQTRLGVLMCVSGTGILNAWVRRLLGQTVTYEEMNELAGGVAPGSDGLCVLPFGNGAERILGDRELGAQMVGIDFNRHGPGHVIRAAQEGIAFGFRYGMEILKETGIHPSMIRAGRANMFLSPVFRDTLRGSTGATIELYETDGSLGAARGAGVGAGVYASPREACTSLEPVARFDGGAIQPQLEDAYQAWLATLQRQLG